MEGEEFDEGAEGIFIFQIDSFGTINIIIANNTPDFIFENICFDFPKTIITIKTPTS